MRFFENDRAVTTASQSKCMVFLHGDILYANVWSLISACDSIQIDRPLAGARPDLPDLDQLVAQARLRIQNLQPVCAI